MANSSQTGDEQRAKFQALSKALCDLAGVSVEEGEEEPVPDPGAPPNSPDALDELLARASDPDIIDALVDG